MFDNISKGLIFKVDQASSRCCNYMALGCWIINKIRNFLKPSLNDRLVKDYFD